MAKNLKAIFFDIDNTLYNSSLQVELARKNAIRAMVEAGLKAEEEKAFRQLKHIVKKYGSNYDLHYNQLLQKFHHQEDFKIIAAGVVAYHNTKLAYLRPFPETLPTLIKLRELGYKLGVITNGKPIKQWEKLIRLGLQNFFHTVIISKEVEEEKPSQKIFNLAAKRIGCQAGEAVMVGDKLEVDILGANKAGMVTVQILKKKTPKKPKTKSEEPDYLITNLKEILKVLEKEK